MAFVAGLALAWALGWRAGDLVWCLWLSSLSVGYALILWNIFHPVVPAWQNRALIAETVAQKPGLSLIGVLVMLFGALFMLAFFTVHFGGFHFVHSVFLNAVFPVFPEQAEDFDIPTPTLYLEVLRRYGWFIPLAFIAERAAFARVLKRLNAPPDTAVTVEAIARRKAANAKGDNDPFFAPYKNVIRMHLLIFFFFGAAALQLDNFAIYVVVYVLYFFPWRLLRKPKPETL